MKRKIRRHGIRVSQLARTAMHRQAQVREHEEAVQVLKRMKEILVKVDIKRVVEQIREDRTTR